MAFGLEDDKVKEINCGARKTILESAKDREDILGYKNENSYCEF
jgi:hypothetical protein